MPGKKPTKKPTKKAAKKASPAKAAKPEKPARIAGDSKGFTQRARKFAERYFLHGNGTLAAKESGYSPGGAAQQAVELLKLTAVQEYLAELREAAREQAGIDGAEVLRELTAIAKADPNELSQVRRVCCRYCYGEGHMYQFTPREWRTGVKSADLESMGIDPDITPPSWYDKRKPPHADCPECFGDGVEEIFLHDTRKLSENARRAYAGVVVTKNGPSVRMHDRAAALLKLGEHAGLFAKKVELSGRGGGPIRTDQVLRIEFVKATEVAPKDNP